MMRYYLFYLFLLLSVSLHAQIQLLNDEFDDSRSIRNWKNINESEGWNIQQLESYDINVSTPGRLQMVPGTASWYEEYRGPYLYKEVVGNFIFSTEVEAFGRDNALPIADFNLAGMMIRMPQQYPNGAYGANGWTEGQQNYIFLSIGAANNNDGRCEPNPSDCFLPHFEVKNTVNSVSTLAIRDIDVSRTALRFARIDNVCIVMYRLDGSSEWEVIRRYNRNDFPDTLQVGFVTYSDWAGVSSVHYNVHNSTSLTPNNPDIIGEFDYARFDSLHIPDALVGLNFMNEMQVPDDSLTNSAFLGFDSEAYCPDSLIIDQSIQDTARYFHFAARQYIQVDSSIGHGNIIVLDAADSTHLNPGFESGSGTELEILTQGCENP